VSDAGTILIACQQGLYFFPAQGGEAKRVDVLGMKPGSYRYPQFLPGGEDFLSLLVPDGAEEAEVYLATLRNEKAVNASLLMNNDTAACYTPAGGGRILFVRGDNLYSQKLDRKGRKLEGDAELIQQGVASLPGFIYNHADFSVSRTGVVAWRAGRAALNQVSIFDRRGKEIGVAGPPGKIDSIFLSPDERLLLAEGADGAWLLTPGQPGSLSLGKGVLFRWRPDGLGLVGRSSSGRLVERAIGSSNELHDLGAFPGDLQDISPDGKRLLTLWKGDIATSSLETAREPAPTMLVHTDEHLMGPSFSPDGRWVVYEALSRGAFAIYAQPLIGPGIRTQIASLIRAPVWRKDGKEVLIPDSRGVWSVSVEAADGGLRFGAPQLLFSGLRPASGVDATTRQMTVSRDGLRIFLLQGVEQPESNVIHIKIGSLK